MSGAVVRKNTEEIVYSGNLIKGEERKEGTQVAFKEKKKFFVLRCVGFKLLTMTEYKDEKDFRKKKVHTNIDSYNAKVKVHKLQMEVRKHKTADILCIVQNKRPLYLATTNRSELDAWYNAFNSILVTLGWKEPPEDGRPRATTFPGKSEKSPTDQVNGDRYSTPAQVEGAFEEEPPRLPSASLHPPHQHIPDVEIDHAHISDTTLDRPPSQPCTPPRSPRMRTNKSSFRSVPIEDLKHEMEASNEPPPPSALCCQRHHIITKEASPFYINLHPIENEKKWAEEVVERREQLVNVKDFYSQYVGSPPAAEALRQFKFNERRRSRSTSDMSKDLEGLQHKYDQRHHPLFEEPFDSSSSDEDNKPPLPARTNSGKAKPIPRQRKSANIRPLSGLDNTIKPSSSLDAPIETPYNHPCSPALQSPGVHRFSYEDEPDNRKRNISDPTPPEFQHTYINMAHSRSSQKADISRRRGPSLLDISRRPLPCPTSDRPSSFVDNLLWEQEVSDGIPIAVPKSELEETLALVKIADYVWIAGKRRGCPDSIAKNFHIGDQLRQINEQIVIDVSIAHALFKTTAKEEVLLTVKRLPYAKIFTMKRTSPDTPWGIEMEETEGNRIRDVKRSCPAADAGIKPRPEGALSKRLCSWIVTHINNAPVSLQGPRDEVKKRLDNTALEMSLVLQPQDFITKLRNELAEVDYSINYL